MKIFVTKKQLKWWKHLDYIQGYSQGTIDTRNEAEKAGVYTWSTSKSHWHNMKEKST